MKHENILLKFALALAIVDLVLIVAILLQVNNLVKDVLEVQNKKLEVEVMKNKLEKAQEAKVEEKAKETERQETKIEGKEKIIKDISDWKEYSSTVGRVAKISFKYPFDWTVTPVMNGYYKVQPQNVQFASIIIDTLSGTEMPDRIRQLKEVISRSHVARDRKEETLNLDGIIIWKISGINNVGNKQIFIIWEKIVEDTNYAIQFSTTGSELYKTIDEQAILDNMVNTFKFISFLELNLLDTSTWKEFSGILANNKVKFSFKYPSINWFIDQAYVIHVLSVRHTKSGFGMLIEELKNFTQENLEMSYRDTISQGRAEETLKIGNATVFKVSGKDANNQTRAFAVWRENINNTNYTIQFAIVNPSENANDLIIFDKLIKTFKLTPVTDSAQDLQNKVIEVTLED